MLMTQDVVASGNGLNELLELTAASGRTASWHHSEGLIYSRRGHRVPFTDQLCLIGLDDQMMPVGTPFLVSGRDISFDGVSFQHSRPLPFQYVALSLRNTQSTHVMVTRLAWCRYSACGIYVTGGKFLHQQGQHLQPIEDWTGIEEL